MKSFSFVIILLCQGTIDCSKSLQFIGNVEYVDHSNFVVSIQRIKRHVCCGSIVAANWVLTASYCIKLDITQYYIRYGVVDCRHFKREQTRKIVEHIKSVPDVLSLLKVNIAFDSTMFGLFAILPSAEQNITVGASGLVYGWDIGTGEPTNLLKRVVFSIQEGQQTTYEFKAGGYGTGISQGNIGSPFIFNTELIGIASENSMFSGTLPDIFYRVSGFLVWINETIRETI